jgi:hypothetical protein
MRMERTPIAASSLITNSNLSCCAVAHTIRMSDTPSLGRTTIWSSCTAAKSKDPGAVIITLAVVPVSTLDGEILKEACACFRSVIADGTPLPEGEARPVGAGRLRPPCRWCTLANDR